VPILQHHFTMLKLKKITPLLLSQSMVKLTHTRTPVWWPFLRLSVPRDLQESLPNHCASRAAASTQVLNHWSRFLLLEFSKLFTSSRHFQFWSSSPVVFGYNVLDRDTYHTDRSISKGHVLIAEHLDCPLHGSAYYSI